MGSIFISPDENRFLNFCETCAETLIKYAPRKPKTIRGNQNPFIYEETSKAIAKKDELQNKVLEHIAVEKRQAFVKQSNYCVSILKKLRKNCYNYVNVKNISDRKNSRNDKTFFFQ